jgi:hypothetical protein
VIWIDHPFITNKWRINVSIWKIITQLATNNAHPRTLFASVEHVPLLATAPNLLHHSTVFGGLHSDFSVIQACYCTSLYSESHNKMALPSLSAQLNYLSLCTHSYMFRHLTTIVRSSTQYFGLRLNAVQGFQCVGTTNLLFTVVYINCYSRKTFKQ